MEQGLSATAVDQAVEWYFRHRSQELSGAQRQAFVEWLRASPLNVREYLAIAALANDLPAAADVPREELQTLIERGRREARASIVSLKQWQSLSRLGLRREEAVFARGTRRWAAAAAVVAVLIGGVAWYSLTGRAIETAHGEQRTLRLTDGSLMHLNSSSQASVHFSDGERLIEVDRGQLMFEVAHDLNRPFRVRVDGVEMTALGTKFDVYRKPSEVAVTVLEGRVLVRSLAGEGAPLRLGAGEQTRIGRKTGKPRAVTVDARAETAWLQGDIRFFRKPLAEVAEEFNRYSEKPVDIEDAALRELRVTGIFNAYDTESFLEFLRRLNYISIQTDSDRIRITTRHDAPDVVYGGKAAAFPEAISR